MRAGSVLLLLLCSSSASASPTAAGVELGYQGLLGSNGAAFAPGPSARVVVDLQDNGLYAFQAAYGLARHRLARLSPLFASPIPETGFEGAVDLHTLVVGAKVRAAGAEFGTDWEPLFEPFVSSDVGVMLSAGHVRFTTSGLASKTQRLRPFADVAAGLDWNATERLTLGAIARVGLVPAMRNDVVTDSAKLEVLWIAQPGLNVALDL